MISFRCVKCNEELLLSESNFNYQLVYVCPKCGFILAVEDKETRERLYEKNKA